MSWWVLNISMYGLYIPFAQPFLPYCPYSEVFFFMFTKNFLYFSLCFLCLLFSVGTTEKSLNPSSLLPSAIYTYGQDLLKLLFSRLNSPRGLSGCLYNRCSKPLTIFIAHCWAHSSKWFSGTGESRAGHSITDVFHQENLPQHAGYTSLVAVGCLCCKVTLLIHGQFCVHQNLQVLSAKPPPRWLVPGPYWCLGYSPSTIRTSHFFWLIFTRFLLAHFSSLSKFLWMATQLSGISTTPTAFV